MFFGKIKMLKKMSRKMVLVDLEWKIFPVAQPWWPTFKIRFTVIFIRKFHRSLLKS